LHINFLIAFGLDDIHLQKNKYEKSSFNNVKFVHLVKFMFPKKPKNLFLFAKKPHFLFAKIYTAKKQFLFDKTTLPKPNTIHSFLSSFFSSPLDSSSSPSPSGFLGNGGKPFGTGGGGGGLAPEVISPVKTEEA
jgi:hypothetical protein